MNAIKNKEKYDHLMMKMMSMVLKGEGNNKKAVYTSAIKIMEAFLAGTFNELQSKYLAESEYTSFDNLAENIQDNILLKSDSALNKALLESKNIGGTAAWRLIESLAAYGLDYSNILAYLFRFYDAKNRPASWDPRDKIEAYYSQYPDKNRGGGFQRNNNEKMRYKEINPSLTSLEARLQEHTMVDNYANIALTDKYSLLNKVSF